MLSAVSCITHTVATVQLSALSAESRRACGVQSLRLAGSHEQACVTHSQAFLANARRCGSAKRLSSLRKAVPQDSNGADTSGEFNLTEYVEAKVERGGEMVEAVFLSFQDSCAYLVGVRS